MILDVTGCAACGKDHCGIAVEPHHPSIEGHFVCPETGKNVLASESESTSVAEAERAGLSPQEQKESDARIRQQVYRSDGEALERVGAKPKVKTADDIVTLEYAREREMENAAKAIRKMPGFETPFQHLNFIAELLSEDFTFITRKDVEYNASWKARGGVGAFMMLARKWDRLEPMAKQYGYDIFAMLEAHPDRIDDVEDLCRYLMLVRAEWTRMRAALPLFDTDI